MPVIGLQKHPDGWRPWHFGGVFGQVRTSTNPGGQLQAPARHRGLEPVSEPQVPHANGSCDDAEGQLAGASGVPASRIAWLPSSGAVEDPSTGQLRSMERLCEQVQTPSMH
jgi:hypothetical protein